MRGPLRSRPVPGSVALLAALLSQGGCPSNLSAPCRRRGRLSLSQEEASYSTNLARELCLIP